jgi:hypothetical protein
VQATTAPSALASWIANEHRQQLALRHGHLLRVTAAGQQRAHLVADLPADDARAQRGDPAAALQPGIRRRARRRRVEALPLHDVGRVDPGRHHVDDHFARSRHRVGHLGELEHVRPARAGDDDGTHEPTVLGAATRQGRTS